MFPVTHVSNSGFLQVLGRPDPLQSTLSTLLVDGLPDDGQQKEGSVPVQKDLSQSVSFSPSFDHFENSVFSLESDTAVLLLLLLETDETLEEHISWA